MTQKTRAILATLIITSFGIVCLAILYYRVPYLFDLTVIYQTSLLSWGKALSTITNNVWSREEIIGSLAILLTIVTGVIRWISTIRTKRRLFAEFSAELYPKEEVEEATRYYVRPDVSEVDLAQKENNRDHKKSRKDLFDEVNRFIKPRSEIKYLLLLADSGMGKTSFVINYYKYNYKKWLRQHKLAIISLSSEDPLERISKIQQKAETTLFLDAFDEDPKAHNRSRERFKELTHACVGFNRVLITSRTQFFLSKDQIPKEAGKRITPRTGPAFYETKVLYIAPLSEDQVGEYIRRRFPWFWSSGKRHKARELVLKVPNLSIRPLLLTYISELLKQASEVKTTWDIYQILTSRWYMHEKSYWDSEKNLEIFSEEAAVQFYLRFLQDEGKTDRVPMEVLKKMLPELEAKISKIDMWSMTSRSLLHHDEGGNVKFAHRSMMEFLFIKKFLSGDERCRDVEWTDQMKQFLLERDSRGNLLFLSFLSGSSINGADLSGVDLSGQDLQKQNLSGIVLRGATLHGAKLQLANLQIAQLQKASFIRHDLSQRADLSQADLSEANLSEADLRRGILVKTVL